jgi:hypothetical protein
MLLSEMLTSIYGQVFVALIFAGLWMSCIEGINPKLWVYVKKQSWWKRAHPNLRGMMVNFGYPKDGITESMAVEIFTWIITMCVTHIISASLMLAVGTLSEVGFDLYDGPKLFVLAFFKDRSPTLFNGASAVPKMSFFLVGGLHHTTVLSMVIPMNTKYIHLPQYHYIAFSLLFSAGVCYLAGHYKFTIDAKTPQGLRMCKNIVFLQFVMNFVSRLFIYFPAAFHALKTFYTNGDFAYMYGGLVGMTFMGLYNLVVLGDAASTAIKWYGKTCKAGELSCEKEAKKEE